jgi:hypothetical protein
MKPPLWIALGLWPLSTLSIIRGVHVFYIDIRDPLEIKPIFDHITLVLLTYATPVPCMHCMFACCSKRKEEEKSRKANKKFIRRLSLVHACRHVPRKATALLCGNNEDEGRRNRPKHARQAQAIVQPQPSGKRRRRRGRIGFQFHLSSCLPAPGGRTDTWAPAPTAVRLARDLICIYTLHWQLQVTSSIDDGESVIVQSSGGGLGRFRSPRSHCHGRRSSSGRGWGPNRWPYRSSTQDGRASLLIHAFEPWSCGSSANLNYGW